MERGRVIGGEGRGVPISEFFSGSKTTRISKDLWGGGRDWWEELHSRLQHLYLDWVHQVRKANCKVNWTNSRAWIAKWFWTAIVQVQQLGIICSFLSNKDNMHGLSDVVWKRPCHADEFEAGMVPKRELRAGIAKWWFRILSWVNLEQPDPHL